VLQFTRDAIQIAYAIPVAVLEAPRVDLVDQAVLVPILARLRVGDAQREQRRNEDDRTKHRERFDRSLRSARFYIGGLVKKSRHRVCSLCIIARG